MDYIEATGFLNSLINYEKGFEKYNGRNYDPDTVRRLLNLAGLEDSNIKIIHIAGTKGKGSTSHYIARLIELALPVKVGLYTSPHLFKINERIKINLEDISDQNLAGLISRYSEFITLNDATYFDALTFLAMAFFIENKCEYVILETGLGGRLDSTNYCRPVLTVITPVSFDHTAILGETISEIAGEKAGIIKNSIPTVSAPQKKEAFQKIKETALEKKSGFFYFPDRIVYRILKRSNNGSVWNASIKLTEKDFMMNGIELAQIGDIFVENYLLSVFSCFLTGIDLNLETIKKAAMLKIPCRINIFGNNLIDVSHNESSLESLFKTLPAYLPGNSFKLYIGILADKEIEKVAAVIISYISLFQEITVFDFQAHRKSGGKQLFNLLRGRGNVNYSDDISQIKLQNNQENFYNVFTGSFYTVEKILKILGIYGA